jgi:hypothetical protein
MTGMPPPEGWATGGRCRVLLRGLPDGAAAPPLLQLLERVLPVEFVGPRGNASIYDGELAVAGADDLPPSPVPANILRIVLPGAFGLGGDWAVRGEVRFADDPAVPFPFRGRRVNTTAGPLPGAIAPRPGERVLASFRGEPVWTLSDRGRDRQFRSAFPLPGEDAVRSFGERFCGERFLDLLPLLHALRELSCRGGGLEPPPLRAAFIVDDPNLHWPRYGRIDYREMALRAERENYHVAFATIPLDTWFTHPSAADLFRRSRGRLSLLVHGNNHARRELAGRYTPVERRALLHQALARIARLERRAGVAVSRVMVPPHGACSEAMLAELPACGFEAACVSAGSLLSHNPGRPWGAGLGFAPVERVEGCTVLPRCGLTGDVENGLLVSAYLGRPLVVRAHNSDFADGPGLFDGLARFVNGLGAVRWQDLTGLSRSSYLWRTDGEELRVRPLADRIEVAVPASARGVRFEGDGRSVWSARLPGGALRPVRPGDVLPGPGADGVRMTFIRRVPAPAGPLMAGGPTAPRLVIRRLLAEARDRFLNS